MKNKEIHQLIHNYINKTWKIYKLFILLISIFIMIFSYKEGIIDTNKTSGLICITQILIMSSLTVDIIGISNNI